MVKLDCGFFRRKLSLSLFCTLTKFQFIDMRHICFMFNNTGNVCSFELPSGQKCCIILEFPNYVLNILGLFIDVI
jgi:hypothetical protein